MTAVCTAPRGDDRSLSQQEQQQQQDEEEVRRWARSPTRPSRWQLQQFRQCEAREAAAHALTEQDQRKLDSSLNETPAPSRELMDLIVAKSWHRAARLCQSSPRLAHFRGPATAAPVAAATSTVAAATVPEMNHPTCLFAACQNRPPVRVVQALLSAHPDATRIQCQLVDNPSLHAEGTNSNNSSEPANPEAGNSSSDRWLPLHMACRYNASLAVLQTLLSHHPEAALHEGTSTSITPAGSASSSISYPVNELYDHRDTFESSFAPTNYRSVFWQKVGALLRAMAECQGSTLAHVAAMSGIPDVLDYALSAVSSNNNSTGSPESTPHPVNAQGQTPLHVALLHAATHHSSPISTNVLTIVTKLLAHDANMANAPDPQGRYPLHYALSLHCHPHVHAVTLKVLQTMPGSVNLEDPITRLFPFQMAASLTTVAADVVDVEVVYRILRTHPSALGRCRSDAVRNTGDSSACGSSSNSSSDVKDELKLPTQPADVPTKEDMRTELTRAVLVLSEPEPSEPEPLEAPGLESPTNEEEPVLESEPQHQEHYCDNDLEVDLEVDLEDDLEVDLEDDLEDDLKDDLEDDLEDELEVDLEDDLEIDLEDYIDDHLDGDLDEATAVSQHEMLEGRLDDGSRMLKPRSCPSSPPKPQRAALALSLSSHGPRSITLSDFFQSPRTKKKFQLPSHETSTVAMAFDEAMSAETCLLSGTVDVDAEDDEGLDSQSSEEDSVAVRDECDPIVRSINGMCSGALLLLTTMFHHSSTDVMASSSHHS